jgi:hypothetical protein
VNSSTNDFLYCSIPFGQCYRYTKTTHRPVDHSSFYYVGIGCCNDWDGNLLDFVYFVGPLTVEQCEDKCISVRDEINSPLRGFERGTTADESDCFCIFDDEVISSVPDGASNVYTDNSGKGEVKSSTSACSIPFGQCYRYDPPRRALENKTNDTSMNSVSACMSAECNATHELLFLRSGRVESNLNLTEVKCSVSSCSSFEQGVDHPYNDITTFLATDPADCCDACHKESGCKLFTWNSNKNLCYL